MKKDKSSTLAIAVDIDVFVHGLFFMRLNANTKNLELIAPKLSSTGSPPHLFLAGIRDDGSGTGTSQLIAQQPPLVNWSNIGLIGNPQPSPPPAGSTISADVTQSILQFSIGEAGLGDWNPTNFFATVLLPWPSDFYSVRCDSFNNTFLFKKSAVGDNIAKHCKGSSADVQVGFITCLHYTLAPDNTIAKIFDKWTPGKNLHWYFEPCKKHLIPEVNQDLTDAGDCFLQASQFDLRMKKIAGIRHTPKGRMCSGTPPGFQKDDDNSLTEDPNARKQGVCPPLSAPQLADVASDPERDGKNINPANCPNFFVGP